MMAKRNAAVHAAGCLLIELFIRIALFKFLEFLSLSAIGLFCRNSLVNSKNPVVYPFLSQNSKAKIQVSE